MVQTTDLQGPSMVFDSDEWEITLHPDRSALIKLKVPGIIVKTLLFKYADARDFLATFHAQIESNAPGCAIAALARHLAYPECLMFEWCAAGALRREREAAEVPSSSS